MDAPTATYRIQLHAPTEKDKGFTFSDVEAQIPYLKKLGISHVYLSPVTTAAKGSQHGYDVVDYAHANPELGGDAGFEHMARALHSAGLKVMIDFVPNHMGVRNSQNLWWQDVLKHGRDSKYASYFDIHWDEESDGKLALPFLGDTVDHSLTHYVRDSATGEWKGDADATHNHPEFELRWDEKQREYRFDYWGIAFPINEAGQALLKKTGLGVEELNHRPDLLKATLDAQHYRPLFWREGFDRLNYRRFFNVNELAGLRVEDKKVFDDVHRGLREWTQKGLIDGVRIDHIDGLRDPTQYLQRLRTLMGERMYIAAEKILSIREALPGSWKTVLQGTTGYGGLVSLGRLYTKPSDALHDAYRQFLGADKLPQYQEILRQSRLLFMEGEMPVEVNRLTCQLVSLAQAEGGAYSEKDIRTALEEVTAAFPVYRTYIAAKSISDNDKVVLHAAIEKAKSHATSDKTVRAIGFLEKVLSQEAFNDPVLAEKALSFTLDYQQFTGPVIAKGTEDTAFYRYHVLRGAAEVGANLKHLGMNPADFTAYLQRRLSTTMNTSSTHDTKLGEDTRARAVTLSHIPEVWSEKAESWKSRFATLARGTAGKGKAITAEDQYLFFQTLVASYPLELLYPQVAADSGADVEKIRKDYIERLTGKDGQPGFMIKALREAKVNTNWVEFKDPDSAKPDPAYEEAAKEFVKGVIADKSFQPELEEFTRKVARMGANVSLSQRILQATMPGIPDIYQGSEGWNLALVDPDNRRTPDFEALHRRLQGAGNEGWDRLSEHWPDGAVKQVLTQRLLELRAKNPDVFNSNEPGELVPLTVHTPDHRPTDEVVAFARVHEGQAAVIVVPRVLNDSLYKQQGVSLGVQESRLVQELDIELPEALRNSCFVDMLQKGENMRVDHGHLRLAGAFRNLPGAVLGSGLRL